MTAAMNGSSDPGGNEVDEAIAATLDRELEDIVRAIAARSGDTGDVAADGDEMPPPPEVSLADVDMPQLLGRAFSDGATGRLIVVAEGVEKSVFFEAGRPVMATSSSPEDRMIEYLARSGRITPKQYEDAREAAAQTGRRMGALLVDLDVMKGDELLPLVRRHYEEVLLSLFAWKSGTWRFDPGATSDPTRARLLAHPAILVSEGLRREYDLARLKVRLGAGAMARVLRLEPSPGGALPIEERLGAFFDGIRSLEDIVRASGAPDIDVCRVALLMQSFGLLASKRAVNPQRDRRIDRERILARHALAKEGDYFQLLGLDRKVSAHDVKRSYDALIKEFSAEVIGPALSGDFAAELADIRAVLGESLQVLGDDTLRAAYRENLP